MALIGSWPLRLSSNGWDVMVGRAAYRGRPSRVHETRWWRREQCRGPTDRAARCACEVCRVVLADHYLLDSFAERLVKTARLYR